MGVPAVLFAVWSLVTSFGDRDERPAAAPAAGLSFGGRTASMSDMMRGAQSALGGFGSSGATASTQSGGDSVSKLERLQRLRESGALTEEEFQREKAKVLSGM